MKSREALRIIDKKIKDGLTKKEIFTELTGKVKFRTDLLQMLAMVPDPELRSNHMFLNRLLFTLLIIVAGVRIISGLYFVINTSLLLLPFLLFGVLMAVFFAYMVWNFRGNVYRILGLFGIVELLKSLSNIEVWNSYTSLDWILNLLLNYIPVSLIVILSFYIGFKVFPYYGFWGMLQEKKLDI